MSSTWTTPLHGPSFRARRVDCLMRYAAGPVVSLVLKHINPPNRSCLFFVLIFPIFITHRSSGFAGFQESRGASSLYNGKHVPPANGMLLDTVKVYTKQDQKQTVSSSPSFGYNHFILHICSVSADSVIVLILRILQCVNWGNASRKGVYQMLSSLYLYGCVPNL